MKKRKNLSVLVNDVVCVMEGDRSKKKNVVPALGYVTECGVEGNDVVLVFVFGVECAMEGEGLEEE